MVTRRLTPGMHPTRISAALILNHSGGRVMQGVRRLHHSLTQDNMRR